MRPALAEGARAVRLAPPEGPVDVVIDTDVTNEIDDQFALVWAALRPDRIRLRGLHACPYALSPDLVRGGALLTGLDQRRTMGTLDRLGMTVDQIPVIEPAEGVARARAELDSLCGRLGLDAGIVRTGADRFLASEDDPVVSEATEHLIETARALDGPLHVLAIGAATNVASALLVAPDLVERLVVVWTSARPSFWPHTTASYNLAQDLHAIRVVLDSGVPLVYLPGYYVGEKIRVTRPEVQDLVAGEAPWATTWRSSTRATPSTGSTMPVPRCSGTWSTWPGCSTRGGSPPTSPPPPDSAPTSGGSTMRPAR